MGKTDLETIIKGVKIKGKLYDHISNLPEGASQFRVKKSRGKINPKKLRYLKGGIWIKREIEK